MKPYQNLSLVDMPGEIWKPIPKYENLYHVSNLGRIKSLERKQYVVDSLGRKGEKTIAKTKILKQSVIRGRKYLSITLCKNATYRRQFVHRLVLSTFSSNELNYPQVDHINTDTFDNRLQNLRWVTAKDNSKNPFTILHQIHSGKKRARKIICTLPTGEKIYFDSVHSVSRYGFNYSAVLHCLRGRNKTHKNCFWEYV